MPATEKFIALENASRNIRSFARMSECIPVSRTAAAWSPLERALINDCRVSGPLTFAEFMNQALYHERYGYYTGERETIGRGGDYFTASDAYPVFARTVAKSFCKAWKELGEPRPFTILEVGAGRGAFAKHVLEYFRDEHRPLYEALRYRIVEASPKNRATEQKLLAEFNGKVVWKKCRDIGEGEITGCIFSNELFDALPAHRLVMTEEGLREAYAAYGADGWKELLGELSMPELANAWKKYGTALEVGQSAEISLEALKIIEGMARKLQRGFVITVDYGDTAQRLYTPDRFDGTVMCYRDHAAHADPYVAIGEQDITAHVNFTMLMKHGEELGLETKAFLTHAEFLLKNGILDFTPKENTIEAQNTRQAIKEMLLPGGFGEEFKVLVQEKI